MKPRTLFLPAIAAFLGGHVLHAGDTFIDDLLLPHRDRPLIPLES